jgi:uncharacterized membrane protein
MSKCLIAEYETNVAAKVALELLEEKQFTIEKVSVVSSAKDPSAEHLHHLKRERDQSMSSASALENRSTSLGMLIGGSIAAPIAAGTLIGPFIIAGPLVGMAIGAAIGSLAGMKRWGVTHDVSADYENRVLAGSVLVIVHDVDSDALEEARMALVETNPKSLEKHELT